MEELNMIVHHFTEGAKPGEPNAIDNIYDSRVQEFIRASTRVGTAQAEPAVADGTNPPDCLLPGALLAECHGEKPAVLPLQRGREECTVHLARKWDIHDAETAREALQWLAEGGDVSVDENTHLQLRAGAFTLFEPKQIDDYENCLISLVEQLDLAPELVENCHTIAAWRAERIAWLARLLVNVGYIRPGEAHHWLRYSLTLTKQNCASWQEYLISACFGSAVTGYDSTAVLKAARNLWVVRPLSWAAYPPTEL